jgi:tRNA (mo5U34)-methyltransferase
MTAGSSQELRDRADAIAWFHSIDLGEGVVTDGLSNLLLTEAQLPDFSGKTVLDIGAWDGYYSFTAERGGATRVVALDHYVWGVDFAARDQYWNECRARGELPDHERDTTEFWRPELPGRRGFELAKEALASNVEPVLADFTTADLDAIGTFDVVLYLGVLYHMKEPLTCLERVRAVTREVAVIETSAMRVVGVEGVPLVRFHAGNELNADFGNWYQPNVEAIEALALAAGFAKVEVVHSAPPMRRSRAIAAGLKPQPKLVREFRAVVHAYV